MAWRWHERVKRAKKQRPRPIDPRKSDRSFDVACREFFDRHGMTRRGFADDMAAMRSV